MIRIDPRLSWNPTGIHMEAGRTYRITCIPRFDDQNRPYSDKGIPCSPDGPLTWMGKIFDRMARDATSPLNPAGWVRKDKVKRLRVLRDRYGRTAHFLTLIGCIGMVTESDLEERAFVIGSSLDFLSDRTGELCVFSNDWPGDPSLAPEDQPYANNTGALEVHVVAL